MNKQNLYLDVNVIQSVPSSNINRDYYGNPKTAIYGGAKRSRVSSQSWKKVTRDYMRAKNLPLGIRTKDMPTLLADNITKVDSTVDKTQAMEKAIAILAAVSLKPKKDKKTDKIQNGALLFLSPVQVENLAKFSIGHEDFSTKEAKEAIKGIIQKDNSIDLALFGRMVAENPELNVEASVQVAHAISTHEVTTEYDYFTALDDLQTTSEGGAAMLGTSSYNSSTLYRYANVNLNNLQKNIGLNKTIEGVKEFIEAFILSMPTGKQNSFANKTLPNYVMLTLRTDTPVNLVSAFEIPIKSKDGIVNPSIKKLEQEYLAANKFIHEPLFNIVLTKNEESSQFQQAANFDELVTSTIDNIAKVLKDENNND